MHNKVLIIDKDEGLYEAFREDFSDSIDVSIAHSSKAGIAKTMWWHPDLIITEVTIPGCHNKLDVLHTLKKESKTKRIPVIIYTKLKEERKAALAEGALDYMLKQNTAPCSVAEKICRFLNSGFLSRLL